MSAIPRSAAGERLAAALRMPIPLPSFRPVCLRLTPRSWSGAKAASGEFTLSISSWEFFRRHWPLRNYWSPSSFRLQREASVHFFREFARRHGDYAIAGLASQAIIAGGTLSDLRLAFFAVGDRPVLAAAASKLVNRTVTPASISEASAALDKELAPYDDQQASGVMRRHLAKVLLVRCVAALLGRPELARAMA